MPQSSLKIVLGLIAATLIAACSGPTSSAAGDVGRGDSCGILQYGKANEAGVVADARVATCETSSWGSPDVASIFVFVHNRSEQQSVDNIVLRYEVVCPGDRTCNYRAPKLRWLSNTSLSIILQTLGDKYCIQRKQINGISISYSTLGLRKPPQIGFITLEGMCQ